MVKSLQRLIFRNGGSTSIVRTVIYQRDKFVKCYEASSFCYMYLASKVARCNISSNTKETNMHAIASQWLTDHSKYVLPPFQNKCLNFVQTLVQSCTTTKVDTYFGIEVAKEKNDPCTQKKEKGGPRRQVLPLPSSYSKIWRLQQCGRPAEVGPRRPPQWPRPRRPIWDGVSLPT